MKKGLTAEGKIDIQTSLAELEVGGIDRGVPDVYYRI
jgi:hypothetical protein